MKHSRPRKRPIGQLRPECMYTADGLVRKIQHRVGTGLDRFIGMKTPEGEQSNAVAVIVTVLLSGITILAILLGVANGIN